MFPINEKNKKSKKRIRSVLFSFFVIVIAGISLFRMERDEIREKKEQLLEIAENCANEVSYQINSTFNSTYVFELMLGNSQEEVDNFYYTAQDLQELYSEIEYVALAPEGEVTELYPINHYNEMKNLDLFEFEKTAKAAIFAKDSSEMSISKPFYIKGEKEQIILGMKPIYIQKEYGRKFWGFAVIGIKFSMVEDKLNHSLGHYAFKLENIENESKEKILYSCNEKQLVNPVSVNLEVLNDEWKLSVSPKDRWFNIGYLAVRIFIIVVICIIVEIMFRLIYRDIVRQSEMQAALEEEKERYQIAMESSSDTIFEYDIKNDVCIFFGSILDGKKTAESKIKLEKFQSKILTGEMFHYQDVEKALDFFIGEKTEHFETRYRVKEEDGNIKYVWLSLKGSVIFEQGNPVKVIGTTRNIQARKEEEIKRIEESQRDNLTGLYTEEYGKILIEQYLTSKSKQEECEFFLIGIDRFQQINDLYGYMFADTILVEVAEIISHIAGDADISVRLGGDEFILFQKNSNSLKAEQTAHEIIERVKKVYAGENETVSVSCSIGRASTIVFNSYEQMLKYAHLAFCYLKDNAKGKQANYINISGKIEQKIDDSRFSERTISEIIDTNSVKDDDIISFAFGILEKTKDLKSAINVLLARIGKKFGLREIRVIEIDFDYLSFNLTYQWSIEKKDMEFEKVTHLKDKGILDEAYDAFEREGAINFTPERIKKYYDKIGKTFYGVEEYSNFLCPMCEEGEYRGAIDFVSNDAVKKWSKDEKHVFKEITKLISTHISRVNADIASKAKSEFLSRMSHEI